MMKGFSLMRREFEGRELNEQDLETVNGGQVVLSESLGVCGFNTTGRVYRTKGDFKEMRNLLIDLYDEHGDMSDAEFDNLVENEYKSRGWI